MLGAHAGADIEAFFFGGPSISDDYVGYLATLFLFRNSTPSSNNSLISQLDAFGSIENGTVTIETFIASNASSTGYAKFANAGDQLSSRRLQAVRCSSAFVHRKTSAVVEFSRWILTRLDQGNEKLL